MTPDCQELARRAAMQAGLEALSSWAKERAAGVHNTKTTMTILRRRILELDAMVLRAGWSAAKVEETPVPAANVIAFKP